MKWAEESCLPLHQVCVFGGGGGGFVLSHRQTRTQLHTLQHTQSCIRLYGETNPVTVSGNVSALARCNLDFAETESPRLQKFFLAFSLFLCPFILSTSGMQFPSLGILINGCPEPHLPNHPWPREWVRWMVAHTHSRSINTETQTQLPWFYAYERLRGWNKVQGFVV